MISKVLWYVYYEDISAYLREKLTFLILLSSLIIISLNIIMQIIIQQYPTPINGITTS